MISIVLPAYNEEKNIGFVVNDISDFFVEQNLPHEIIVVDDGSKDNTAQVLNNLVTQKNIVAVFHPVNIGYGSALISGFEKANGDLIFFTDADRQFDIKDIKLLLEKIKNYDFVVGFRQNRKDSANRIFYAKLFNFASRVFFGIKVKDIDCAFKLFKSYVLRNINLTETGALINLEIFALAQKKGYKFAQVPVSHFERTEGKQTGGNFKVIFKAIIGFFKLRSKI